MVGGIALKHWFDKSASKFVEKISRQFLLKLTLSSKYDLKFAVCGQRFGVRSPMLRIC